MNISDLENPRNVRFCDLLAFCEEHFGDYRVKGDHHIFKMPWQGDPRINIQPDRNGKALPYQVKQVRKAIEKKRQTGNENGA